MPLDPQVRELRDRQGQQGFAAYRSAGIDGARASSRAVIAWRASLAPCRDEVATVEDRTIPSAEGTIPARVYLPAGAPTAVVTYLHGGGFVIGDLDASDPHCRAICTRSQAVVVSVDYRLAPEHPFPAPVHDGYAALRWSAETYAGPAGLPLVVAGDSAGGNLAATAAMLARDVGYPRLAAQLLIYPMLDPTMSAPSIVANGEGYLLDAPTLEWFWRHYLGDPPAGALLAAPLTAHLAGLAPALVVTAELDPLRDEGERYAELLAGAGVTTQIQRYDGLVHGFFGWSAFVEAADAAVSQICGQLTDLLQRPAA
ncbi:MAG TPA: alpha/beta hydrolase [Actinomycetes bacterium]|nr:alpha/beta hydrolase [Actinomycetes bacterium]